MIGWALGGVFLVCCLVWFGAFILQILLGLVVVLGHVLAFVVRAIVVAGAALYWLVAICFRRRGATEERP